MPETAPTPAQRLATIKERAVRANAGPWRHSIAGKLLVERGENGDQHSAIGLLYHPADLVFTANAREDVPWLIEQVEAMQRERDELRAEANAIMSALEWDGDGYSWHPTHGDYREAKHDALARATVAYQTELATTRSLLYRLARHMRNTDETPAVKWGAQTIELLAEVQAIDPAAYDVRVKAEAAKAAGAK